MKSWFFLKLNKIDLKKAYSDIMEKKKKPREDLAT